MNLDCNVCGSKLVNEIYSSEGAQSLTSLGTVHKGITEFFFCQKCGHLQSAQIENIEAFYDHDYDILVTSEEEDQIYEIVNGKNIYRTEHQVTVLQKKITLCAGFKVLDYGCAKSSTMRFLQAQSPQLMPYLFDVSDRYISFWEKFLRQERWATYLVPKEWTRQFDLVTSFFSLEHMGNPQAALQQIAAVLKPSGVFYGIVPHIFSNTADMIVIDHVNHFTQTSLRYLLASHGFENIDIDESSHRGALIFSANKSTEQSARVISPLANELSDIHVRAAQIARFWKAAGSNIRQFEDTLPAQQKVAIYGAGFYGAFIASRLKNLGQVEYIIDQNPFLHGRTVHDIPVISPANLPNTIDTILVGLNPLIAQKTIGDIDSFKGKNLNYFYF